MNIKDIGLFPFRGARFSNRIAHFCVTFVQCLHIAILDIQGILNEKRSTAF
jgi:hypothetical protein